MNKTMLSGLIVFGLFAGGIVQAQTCATPIPLSSNTAVNGNTCVAPTGTGVNSLPGYGSVPSPQTEIVYSFVAQGANGSVTVTDTGAFGATVVLMPSPCASGTDILAAGAAGTPMPLTGLTNGQTYYLIVTGDPGGPANACGAFTMTPPTLPVSLQGFSVE